MAQASTPFGDETDWSTKLSYELGADGTDLCQCTRDRGDEEYRKGLPMAQYVTGQTICLAYPSKNHVADTCENDGFMPDAGMTVYRSYKDTEYDPPGLVFSNPTQPNLDEMPFDLSGFQKRYNHRNGQHERGKVDYKGFQRCPQFCTDPETALCTMCFQLEDDLTPGRYTFLWLWRFKDVLAGWGPTREFYTTCWEAVVDSASK